MASLFFGNAMYLIDKKLKHNVWRYIFQCGMATLTIIGILAFLNYVQHGAIIAALGASSFIVFTMPNSYPSRPRPLIGGYIIGVASGVACSLLMRSSFVLAIVPKPYVATVIFGGLAVGLAMFLMAITNTEHAPAAGMALALVLNPWELETIVFIFASVLWLKFIKKLLRRHLMDFRDLPTGSGSNA